MIDKERCFIFHTSFWFPNFVILTHFIHLQKCFEFNQKKWDIWTLHHLITLKFKVGSSRPEILRKTATGIKEKTGNSRSRTETRQKTGKNVHFIAYIIYN